MKLKPILAAMLLLAITTFLGLTCKAQAAPLDKQNIQPPAATLRAEVVEALPDGDFVVRINGAEYRAMSASHVRALLDMNDESKRLAEENRLLDLKAQRLEALVTLVKKDAALSDAQRDAEHERAARFEAMYDGEHALRLQAEQFTRRGRVTKFFDNLVVQVATKVGVPFVETWIAAQRE